MTPERERKTFAEGTTLKEPDAKAQDSEHPADDMMEDEEGPSPPDDSGIIVREEASKETRPPPLLSAERWHMLCAPISGKEVMHLAPLLLCLCALLLTGIGSWRCSYFKGATISFTGGNYGLWTIEDGTGNCQQWDVLFFSYSLGGPLIAARVFSMASMLFGLGLLTTMAQASEIHAVSWSLGLLFFLLFMISLATTSSYNLWVTFFLLTYIILILIVRSLFIHPVHRRITPRGCKILGSVCGLCAFCCLMTLVVLRSDFCTCDSITAEKLEGRDPGDPCRGECRLGAAGAIMIVAPVFWIAAGIAVIRFGIQADFEDPGKSKVYAHYSRESITTRVLHGKERSLRREQALAAYAKTLARGIIPLAAGKKLPKNDEGMEPDNNDATDHGESNISVHIEPPSSFEEVAVASNQDEESGDDRSRCKKLCCDYRVAPRNKKESWMFWSFRVMLFFLCLIYLFVIIVKVGSRVENTNAAKAPDTSYNFITDVVCGVDTQNPSNPFQTFPTKQDAIMAGYQVAHCGACGQCSNAEDIRVYVDTRDTIAKTSKTCGVKVVLGDHEDVVDCLEDRIGFSRACTECWADNMESTARSCLFTCMTVLFTGFMADNNVEGAGDRGWLNQCLFCDEKLSGPAFVTCSGVARRRLGIKSEIERNPEEQCTKVDFDWLQVDWSKFEHPFGAQ